MPPKRPQQHETDKKARSILDGALSSWASTNHHQEDYGVDCTCEIFATNDSSCKAASGIDFQIQLKGTTDARYIDDAIAFSLKTDLLIHAIQNKRIPFFLVVIDVIESKGAFVFLQEYPVNELPRTWQSQETVSLRLPLANSIHDATGFEKCVRLADARMAVLRPGSIDGALKAECNRMQSLDPRIQVEITANSKGQQIEIRAIDKLEFTIQFNGPPEDLKQIHRRFLDKGELVTPLDFGVTVNVTGFPLIPTTPNAITQLQFCRQCLGAVRISRNRANAEVGLIEVGGAWTIGAKTAQLTATLPNRLLSVNAMISEPGPTSIPVDFEFLFDISDWIGKDIVTGLKHFDTLYGVLNGIESTDSLKLELTMEGNVLATVFAPVERLEWAMGVSATLSIVKKLKHICQRTKTGIKMPESLYHNEVCHIEYAYAFITGEEVEISIASGTIETFGGVEEVKVGDIKDGCRVVLHRDKFRCDILGKSIDCGASELVIESAQIRAVHVGSDDAGQTVTWEFVPKGRMFSKLLETA